MQAIFNKSVNLNLSLITFISTSSQWISFSKKKRQKIKICGTEQPNIKRLLVFFYYYYCIPTIIIWQILGDKMELYWLGKTWDCSFPTKYSTYLEKCSKNVKFPLASPISFSRLSFLYLLSISDLKYTIPQII